MSERQRKLFSDRYDSLYIGDFVAFEQLPGGHYSFGIIRDKKDNKYDVVWTDGFVDDEPYTYGREELIYVLDLPDDAEEWRDS